MHASFQIALPAENPFPLNFSCVCRPEPVLVNRSFLYRNGSEKGKEAISAPVVPSRCRSYRLEAFSAAIMSTRYLYTYVQAGRRRVSFSAAVSGLSLAVSSLSLVCLWLSLAETLPLFAIMDQNQTDSVSSSDILPYGCCSEIYTYTRARKQDTRRAS